MYSLTQEKWNVCLDEIILEVYKLHPEITPINKPIVKFNLKEYSEEDVIRTIIEDNDWLIEPDNNELFQQAKIDFNNLFTGADFYFQCYNKIRITNYSEVYDVLGNCDNPEQILNAVKVLDPENYDALKIQFMFSSDTKLIEKTVDRLDILAIKKATEYSGSLDFTKYVDETSESIMAITKNIINKYY
ncbi:hypothetical protein AAGG74_17090 [Bacillus mexicanus]|uniref:hypothetical protein n=1 Tax=Bacillus mexicanus TaxID=2834415 RepID=UPI003D1CB385